MATACAKQGGLGHLSSNGQKLGEAEADVNGGDVRQWDPVNFPEDFTVIPSLGRKLGVGERGPSLREEAAYST